MRYKDFGSTGKKLSVFGCGGTRFDMEKSIEEHADKIIYAHSKGINHFDTTPHYNYNRCEDIYAQAIKSLPRDTYYITTKDAPAFINSKQEAKDTIKRSLDKLKLDYFDFYYMWNVKKIDEYYKAISVSDHYEALLEAKSEGLISHICLSSHLTGPEAIKIIDDGKIEGILLNMHILNFPYTIDAAFRAKEKGIGVGTMSPLMGGLIPNNQNRLKFLQSESLTPTEEALKFVCGLPCVDFSYVGFRNKDEIDNACEIADLSHIVDDIELENIRKKVGAGIEKACTSCMYCMDHCPKSLPIAEYMTYYNFKYLFNMPQDEFEEKLTFHRDWFMLAKRKADAKDCVKCGNCEEQCTQRINIIERLEELADIEARL